MAVHAQPKTDQVGDISVELQLRLENTKHVLSCLIKLTTSFSTITRYKFFMTESVNMAVSEVHNQKLIKLGIYISQ